MANRKANDIEKKERLLRKMIKERTGKDSETWLEPQIHLTASNWVVLDKIRDQIIAADDLVHLATGSTQQLKMEVNPLLPHYDKMSRTLSLQFQALGLNYNTTPSKVTENTKAGGGDQDPLTALLNDVKDNL